MQRLKAVVAATLVAEGDGPVTAPCAALDLSLEGVVGDARHFGFARRSGGREPWHPRGSLVANDRQVSAVCPIELASIAARLDLARIEPGWIGANLVLAGVDRLSFLPRGARLIFPSGATLFVTDQNAPCRSAGAAIARAVGGAKGLDLRFARAAQGLRGFVAMVERAGRICAGDDASILLPARQWLYEPRAEALAAE